MSDQPVTVTDEDREAADKHGLWLLDDEREDLAAAFAAHRIAAAQAERDAVVAFLNCCGGELACKYADWIEGGEHLK